MSTVAGEGTTTTTDSTTAVQSSNRHFKFFEKLSVPLSDKQTSSSELGLFPVRSNNGSAKGTSYTTSLVQGKPRKLRSATEGASHLSLMSDHLARGLKVRGLTEFEAMSHLHPRASIAIPMMHASEYLGEASIFSCVISLTNSVIGAGILGIPYCFVKLGVIPGVTILICNGCLSGLACFLVMMASKTIGQSTTFSDLGWKTFPKAMWYIDLMNFIGNVGTLIAYLMIVGDMAPHAFQHIFESKHSWVLGRTAQITLFSILLLWPFIHQSTFDNLRHASTIAVCCFAYIVIVTVLYASVPNLQSDLKDTQDTGNGNVHRWPVNGDWIGFITVLPIVVLAFSASQNAVALTHELKNNTVPRIVTVVVCAFAICSGIYLIVGLCAYSSFTDATESDVLLNYPSNSWAITILRVGLAIAVSFSYPMWIHPCRENLSFLVFGTSAVDRDRVSYLQYLIMTYGLWALSYGVALLVKDLGIVMALTGAISSVVCLFVAPGLMFYYRCTPKGGPLYSPCGQSGRPLLANTAAAALNENDDYRLEEPSTMIKRMMSPVMENNNSLTPAQQELMDDDGSVFVERDQSVVKEYGSTKMDHNHDLNSPALQPSSLLIPNNNEIIKEWNVWPSWMDKCAVTFAIVGSVLVPIFVVVQFL